MKKVATLDFEMIFCQLYGTDAVIISLNTSYKIIKNQYWILMKINFDEIFGTTTDNKKNLIKGSYASQASTSLGFE